MNTALQQTDIESLDIIIASQSVAISSVSDDMKVYFVMQCWFQILLRSLMSITNEPLAKFGTLLTRVAESDFFCPTPNVQLDHFYIALLNWEFLLK